MTPAKVYERVVWRKNEMKNIRRIYNWVRARRLWILAGVAVLAVGSAGFILAADRVCHNASRNKIFLSTDSVPTRDVALVLGTGKLTQQGNPNFHFNQRMDAAATARSRESKRRSRFDLSLK